MKIVNLNNRRSHFRSPPHPCRRFRKRFRLSKTVTTAIEYPNGEPHLGHAYEKVLADIYVRNWRLKGEEVHFTLGLDEHSTPVQEAANRLGLHPQEYCDNLTPIYQKTWKSLHLSPFEFLRTSSRQHGNNVTHFLQRGLETGDIYPGTYRKLTCSACARPIKKHEIKDGVCKKHQIPVLIREEESLFFRLSKYAPRILDHIEANTSFIQPDAYRKIFLQKFRGYLENGGVEDLSISRENGGWGIPIPGKNHWITYVWYDALIQYLTGSGYPHPGRFQKNWPADLQVLGKDVVPFHAGLWLGILFSQDISPPKRLLVHGHILLDGTKASKSLGMGRESIDQGLQFGADPLRYFFARQFKLDADAHFRFDEFKFVFDNELGKRFSIFLPWAERLVQNEFNGMLQPSSSETQAPELFQDPGRRYERFMEEGDIHRAAIALKDLIIASHRFFNQHATRDYIREAFREKKPEILGSMLEQLRLLALYAWPFMPVASETILQRLGISDEIGSGSEAVERQWKGGKFFTKRIRHGPSLF